MAQLARNRKWPSRAFWGRAHVLNSFSFAPLYLKGKVGINCLMTCLSQSICETLGLFCCDGSHFSSLGHVSWAEIPLCAWPCCPSGRLLHPQATPVLKGSSSSLPWNSGSSDVSRLTSMLFCINPRWGNFLLSIHSPGAPCFRVWFGFVLVLGPSPSLSPPRGMFLPCGRGLNSDLRSPQRSYKLWSER